MANFCRSLLLTGQFIHSGNSTNKTAFFICFTRQDFHSQINQCLGCFGDCTYSTIFNSLHEICLFPSFSISSFLSLHLYPNVSMSLVNLHTQTNISYTPPYVYSPAWANWALCSNMNCWRTQFPPIYPQNGRARVYASYFSLILRHYMSSSL